jgi:hypothetical protein
MSGWNASSRPTWDSHGGAGENAQASSAPDAAEATDDDWPEPSASLPGSGYGERQRPEDFQADRRPPRHRADGPPDARPVGPPPDIFRQDPSYPAAAQRDQGQRGYGRPDPGQPDRAEYGYGREAVDREPNGREAYSREPYGREAYGREGYGAAQQDYERQEDPRRDFAQRDYAGRDYAGRDYVGRDDLDPDSAARMDPALQDFFVPQPSRSGAQPGSGRPGEAGRSGQPGRPGRPGRPSQADPWNTPATRPATRSAPPSARSARRAGHRSRRRGLTTAGIAVGLVVALGIAAAVIVLTHKSGTSTATGPTSTPTAAATPAATASASTKATAGQPGAQPAGYTLATPATAGGYAKLAQAPAAVSSTAGRTALTVFRTATNTSSGKLPSDVTAAYQLSGGQVMTFVGYRGSFDPAKVMANVATLGTHGQPYDAGPHGGKLACATAPGTPSGTVCVWVTTTTLGVTEFFSSVGPEVVTIQSKAATDTVRLREGVEVVKS